MDKTETYIKMCEKAEEIEELRKGSNSVLSGDVINLRGGHTVVFGSDSNMFYWNIAKPVFIWLPRQDQLQAMVYTKESEERYACSKPRWLSIQLNLFWDFCPPNYANLFTSMEQLWLAFVMKEKYNKAWNGEEWIIVADAEKG